MWGDDRCSRRARVTVGAGEEPLSSGDWTRSLAAAARSVPDVALIGPTGIDRSSSGTVSDPVVLHADRAQEP